MRHFLHFLRIAQDSKINAREEVKMRHFRAKSHLDTLLADAVPSRPARPSVRSFLVCASSPLRRSLRWARVARSKKSNSSQLENFHRQIPPNPKMLNFFCIFGRFREGLLFDKILQFFPHKYCIFF